MDSAEERRLLSMLDSVEKEQREEDRQAILAREVLRRQLFAGEASQGDEVNRQLDIEGSDDDENDIIEDNDHDSSSEMSTEDAVERVEEHELLVANDAGIVRPTNQQVYIMGKDGTRWCAHFDVTMLRGRVRNQNIIRAERSEVRLPCPRGRARSVNSPFETWKLLFPDECIERMVEYTNIWIRKNKENYTRERDAKETDRDEIHAVIGLLYLSGILKTSHTNLDELWAADGFGVDYFRATMSLRRFKYLLRALRFDDITTRRRRQALDKLAPIRQLFEEFVVRCQEMYALSGYITIDEMLDPFRGCCSFKQYIPQKPAKYGVKLFALCDSRTYYTYNLEIYAGKNQTGPYQLSNSPRDVVLRMIQPISGTGRHLTMDNWFMSVPLAKELYNNHRTTVVGTLRKNKPEIPPSFVDGKIRPPLTSLFAYHNDCTLVSYMPKKNKVVLIVSTFHHTDEIDVDTGDKNKPIILTSYNKYKGGVDTVDFMKQAYSTGKKTNRWTMRVFFSLLDIAGINSYIILRNNIEGEVVSSRRVFIKSLEKSLCTQQMTKRLSIRSTTKITRDLIKTILGQPVRPALEERDNEPRSGRCYACGRVKNRKSTTRCSSCRYFICREHTKFTCAECAGEIAVQQSSEEDDV